MIKKTLAALALATTATAVPATAAVISVNFNDLPAPYLGQAGVPTQGITGDFNITNGGTRLKTSGDAWVNFALPITIDSDTRLQIEVRDRAPQTSEILGIMFLDNYLTPSLNRNVAFAFAGSQDWGITDFRTSGEGWEAFDIGLGNYNALNGASFEGIAFFTDDDAGGADSNARGRFRNLTFTGVPEPSSLLLLAAGAFGFRRWARR